MNDRSLLVALMLCLAGCGKAEDGYQRYTVSGTVNLDGKPLETGEIVFYPRKEGPVVSGAPIQNGKFSLPESTGLTAGGYRVAIKSEVVEGGGSAEDQFENPPSVRSLIPAKYNTETTLTAEVMHGPQNVLNFDLKSE
ncbi:hypothetical protein [Planctomicrobium piriforme]|uniref:Carboxypeptidase regulatory-like domain-containing protein n=1 Tax=Planctomicrobium piriforme TaxID=1576369 RepID=A0A1I3HPN2_9PLAN|nr:hypothetical protein [Planctomicrobium piriforme]SFI37695.1 hypothetical protein SAMN05421753_108146 [Planctomicrobium piriforme]